MQNARLVIGASTENENILWATKFYAHSFVFLEIASRKIMVTGALEYGRAQKEAAVDEVVLDETLTTPEGKRAHSEEEQALALLRGFDVSSVTVEKEFPAIAYRYLTEHGISISFSEPLFPERMVKTAKEIAHITYTQRAMEEVFPMLLDVLANAKIKDGKLWSGGEYLTSEMLRVMFDVELMRRDCVCDVTIIASGDQAADPHCLGYGPIVANTPIVFDMFPRSRKSWYWSDMSRTVVKGTITPEARKMYQAVHDTQCAAVEKVKTGIEGCDIHGFVKEEFERRGFVTGVINGKQQGFFHSTGHGVGLEIHELPRVNLQKGHVLEAGNVITIEPGLYYPGIGGVRIEDTVVVTKDGCENLARLPKDLIELP